MRPKISTLLKWNEYIRFHDANSSLKGFFEYPTPEAFFTGLAEHIHTEWPTYLEGYMHILLLPIPKYDVRTLAPQIELEPPINPHELSITIHT